MAKIEPKIDDSIVAKHIGASGWFKEAEVLWKGQRFALEVKEVLYAAHSKYQEILVFESVSWGKVLVLDGVIQLTERDECSYQELGANLPLFASKRPRNVLIVGGGDGGVLREVLRHREVMSVTLVDIDSDVCAVSRRFFADSVGRALVEEDERVEVCHLDAAVFLREHENEFDVVIMDSSDPVGPAESLYTKEFKGAVFRSLREGGVFCMQAECHWLHLEMVRESVEEALEVGFGFADYASVQVPTYPCGQIGFLLASKVPRDSIPEWQRDFVLRIPNRRVDESYRKDLKYYSEEVHVGAFVLPNFVRRKLQDLTGPNPTGGDLPKPAAIQGAILAAAAASTLLLGAAFAAGYFLAPKKK